MSDEGRYRFSWERGRGCKARRDPSRPAEVDVPRLFVGASVLGVALWGLWRFTSDRAKTEIQHDPEPAPAAPVAPAGTTEMKEAGVQKDDLVVVRSSFLEKALGLSIETEGLLFRVSIALPQLPSVTASPVAPIALPDAKPFTGPMIVPRSEILRMVAPEGAPPPTTPTPTPAPPASKGLTYLGDPIALKSGERYRARLALEGMQATFATADLVKAQFEGLGFRDVQAWDQPSTLPGDWPMAEKVPAAKGVWYVQGSWAGAAQAMKRPDGIAKAWVA